MADIIGLLIIFSLFGASIWFLVNVLGLGKHGQVKSIDSVPGAKELLMEQYETDNPWLQRAFKSPAYGLVPKHAKELMQRVSADEGEQVIGAVWTRHGKWKMGYLVITTTYLRYIETFPFKEDDFWQYNSNLEASGRFAFGFDRVVTVGYKNFQVKGMKRAKEFVKLYKDIQQGLLHDDGKQTQQAQAAVVQDDSVSGELERLAALHSKGVLNDSEFHHAKRKLLGDTAQPKQRPRKRVV